jgi:CheY-like chemotaxis protein
MARAFPDVMEPAAIPGRVRVLVVDDEPALLETTAALLSDDYEVTTAPNGEEALDALRRLPFDVVCTDFRMPGMDGLELLREGLRVQPSFVGILVTAYAERSCDAAAKAERHFVLLKPYQVDQLVELIARAAGVGRLRRSVAAAVAQAERLKTGTPGPAGGASR